LKTGEDRGDEVVVNLFLLLKEELKTMMSFNLDETRKQESSFVTIVQIIPVVLNEFPGHVTAFHTERRMKNSQSHFN